MRPPYDTDTVVLRTSALLVMPALLFVGYLRFLLGVVGAAVRGRSRRPAPPRRTISMAPGFSTYLYHTLARAELARESKTTGTNMHGFVLAEEEFGVATATSSPADR